MICPIQVLSTNNIVGMTVLSNEKSLLDLLVAVNTCDLRCLLKDEVDRCILMWVGNWWFHVQGATMRKALSVTECQILALALWRVADKWVVYQQAQLLLYPRSDWTPVESRSAQDVWSHGFKFNTLLLLHEGCASAAPLYTPREPLRWHCSSRHRQARKQ